MGEERAQSKKMQQLSFYTRFIGHLSPAAEAKVYTDVDLFVSVLLFVCTSSAK